jgi:hypothetical protein
MYLLLSSLACSLLYSFVVLYAALQLIAALRRVDVLYTHADVLAQHTSVHLLWVYNINI